MQGPEQYILSSIEPNVCRFGTAEDDPGLEKELVLKRNTRIGRRMPMTKGATPPGRLKRYLTST
jgi:hypothetical protein